LEIRIEDDGPGIPPELAQSLLKRGERADPSVPGHGLGLAIVNSIVCAYGGRLAIERSELGGAALLVRLPA
jgi:two-component system sensor histidine kinase PhoQ